MFYINFNTLLQIHNTRLHCHSTTSCLHSNQEDQELLIIYHTTPAGGSHDGY